MRQRITTRRPAPTNRAHRHSPPLARRSLQRTPGAASRESAAPPGVDAALRTPGQPLDRETRARMEPGFGHNFSQVRVHTGPQAAESASALGAQAYTVGSDMVFGAGQYAPQTPAGQQLIAHELAHVVQQQGAAAGSITVGEPDSAHERAAARQAERLAHGGFAEPQPRVARQLVQRSLLGGIVGGLLGAAGGIVLGALAGGVVGAVIGGVVGLVVGAAIGNDATTRSRKLSSDEITMAREIFRDSIDYTEIEITRDSMYSAGAPRTIGNTIHLRSDWGHFQGDTLDLTDKGRETLIHEMTHVWQYQNGGLAYIPLSLIAQLRARISSGDRNAAYNWRAAHDAGIPWEEWNPEQQAAAVEEYNRLLGLTRDGRATAEDYQTLAILLPYIERVRRGEGAPGGPARRQAAGDTGSSAGSTP